MGAFSCYNSTFVQQINEISLLDSSVDLYCKGIYSCLNVRRTGALTYLYCDAPFSCGNYVGNRTADITILYVLSFLCLFF